MERLRRLLRFTCFLAGLAPARAGAEGFPLRGEERSFVAPLELGFGYAGGETRYPSYVFRAGYTFRPAQAFTAAFDIRRNPYGQGPFESGHFNSDLRLGLQASGFVWRDFEILLSGFHRLRLSNLMKEEVVPCGSEGYCWGPGDAEWDFDPFATIGLQWGSRYWLFPRLSVMILDGREWNWGRERIEPSPLSLLLGLHF